MELDLFHANPLKDGVNLATHYLDFALQHIPVLLSLFNLMQDKDQKTKI